MRWIKYLLDPFGRHDRESVCGFSPPPYAPSAGLSSPVAAPSSTRSIVFFCCFFIFFFLLSHALAQDLPVVPNEPPTTYSFKGITTGGFGGVGGGNMGPLEDFSTGLASLKKALDRYYRSCNRYEFDRVLQELSDLTDFLRNTSFDWERKYIDFLAAQGISEADQAKYITRDNATAQNPYPGRTPSIAAAVTVDYAAALANLIFFRGLKWAHCQKPSKTDPPYTPPPYYSHRDYIKSNCKACAGLVKEINWDIEGFNDMLALGASKAVLEDFSKLLTLDEENLRDCEKKCVSTTEEEQPGGNNRQTSSTVRKTKEHKTTEKKQRRKKTDDTNHETASGPQPSVYIGIGGGFAGGHRGGRGDDKIRSGGDRGRQSGFGTREGGGVKFGR